MDRDLFMGAIDDSYTFDQPLPIVLSTSTDRIDVALHRLEVGRSVFAIGSVTVASVSAAVDSDHLGLDWVDHIPGWDETEPVEVTLTMIDDVRAAYSSSDDIVRAVASSEPGPAQAMSSWRLVEATQSVEMPGDPSATIDVGIRAPDGHHA